MAIEKKPRGLRRLKESISRMLRVVRRTWHQRTGAQPLDVSRIEYQILRSLYRKAAADLGLEAYDIGRVLCIAGRGKLFRVWSCTTEFDIFPLCALTEDKVFIKTLFREHGISVPDGRAFGWRDRSLGLEYALSLGRPCVVKPASDTSGGKGVTSRLTKRSDIARAFRFAGLFATQVLIEEFIPGDSYRFLVYKGKCISVLRRELATVTGNGAATVRELVDGENRSRIQNSDWRDGDPLWMPLPTSAHASRQLKSQGLDWNCVPKPGELVHLAGLANIRSGCTFSEVLGKAHPALIRAAEQAAGIIGMNFAGVDIISTNIEAPAYHLLEINISPAIEIHYALRNPEEMRNPIRTILADYFEIGVAGSTG